MSSNEAVLLQQTHTQTNNATKNISKMFNIVNICLFVYLYFWYIIGCKVQQCAVCVDRVRKSDWREGRLLFLCILSVCVFVFVFLCFLYFCVFVFVYIKYTYSVVCVDRVRKSDWREGRLLFQDRIF